MTIFSFTLAPAQLVITRESSSPVIHDIVIREGTNLSLQCMNVNRVPVYTGRPSWTNLNGEDVGSDTLVIPMAEPTISGTYLCRVPNRLVPTKRVTITVHCKWLKI